QIQNFHWFYVWGPCLSTILVLLAWGEVAGRPARARLAVPALLVGTLLCVAASAWLRWAEATRTRESLALIADCRAYRAQAAGGGAALGPRARGGGPPGVRPLGGGAGDPPPAGLLLHAAHPRRDRHRVRYADRAECLPRWPISIRLPGRTGADLARRLG